MKIEILKSEFSEIFQDVMHSNNIYLNCKETSSKLWDKYIDKESTSYFNLQDENWLIKSNEIELAIWLDAYNEVNYSLIKEVLINSVTWNSNDRILFFISRLIAIETRWEIFLNSWINFLECDDDCPIIINTDVNRKEAIVFKPIGNVFYLTNR